MAASHRSARADVSFCAPKENIAWRCKRLTHPIAYATVNFGDLRKLPQEKNIFYIVSVILAGRLGAIFLQTGWVARVVS